MKLKDSEKKHHKAVIYPGFAFFCIGKYKIHRFIVLPFN